MASMSTGCLIIIIAIIAAILAKAIKVVISSSWYKKSFARKNTNWANSVKKMFDPVKRKLFDDLDPVNGDVLEIGIGGGENFDYYPHGTSLIAVDANPHVEEFLKKSLERVGDRIQLKKFVAASAEDMSCTGQIGVEDNSVAAVVCTKLLCSLTDDQTGRTIQEVKRVLMPGGRFYFLEHVAGNPWTFQYFLQHLVTKSLIWPTLFNGCCCDRETLPYIEQGGFKMVKSEKTWLDWSPEMFSGCESTFWGAQILLYFSSSILVGFAEKEQITGEKKLL